MLGRCNVISMGVDVTNLNNVLQQVDALGKSHKATYMCVSNVHMCMEVFDSSEFSGVVNSADFVIPDGRPIFWAQRLLGHELAEQVRGQDIMNALCKSSGQNKLNIGFYGGGSDALLTRVVTRLSNNFPDIKIVFTYSPPFRPLTHEEDVEVIKKINESCVNVLFVGTGCPKQERWMAEHKDKLNCVMIGVGAAFDFIAGDKRHAPKWMQKIGLEWLFRLCSEPQRLWKRYLIQNPRFIYHFSKQLLKQKYSG